MPLDKLFMKFIIIILKREKFRKTHNRIIYLNCEKLQVQQLHVALSINSFMLRMIFRICQSVCIIFTYNQSLLKSITFVCICISVVIFVSFISPFEITYDAT